VTITVANANVASPTREQPTYAPSALPSERALALEQAPMHELETIFQRGALPELDALVGWEFRGINRLWLNPVPVASVLGIKKFVKGFYRDEHGRVMGYNRTTTNNVLDGRWTVSARRHSFYEVTPVDPTAHDNKYLHAVLLDYSRGGNRFYDPSSVLRDYLVQVDNNHPELFLGKAYVALGPLRVHTNFFILERFRVGLTDFVTL
jgi:hypothetical protein